MIHLITMFSTLNYYHFLRIVLSHCGPLNFVQEIILSSNPDKRHQTKHTSVFHIPFLVGGCVEHTTALYYYLKESFDVFAELVHGFALDSAALAIESVTKREALKNTCSFALSSPHM